MSCPVPRGSDSRPAGGSYAAGRVPLNAPLSQAASWDPAPTRRGMADARWFQWEGAVSLELIEHARFLLPTGTKHGGTWSALSIWRLIRSPLGCLPGDAR